MTRHISLRELGRYVNEEHGGVIAKRGTPYSCTQEQIETYTLEPYCRLGKDHLMLEHDTIKMLEDFLDPSRPPTKAVRAALDRIYDAMYINIWFPDVVIKAMSDIDEAFFMGRLKGSVSIQWTDRIPSLVQGTTCPHLHGCSSIYLSLERIFHEALLSCRKMWQVLFHELIHAFTYALSGYKPLDSYERAQGWSDGHGYLFRRCLQAVEGRTKKYLEGFVIASPTEDITDYRTLGPTHRES